MIVLYDIVVVVTLGACCQTSLGQSIAPLPMVPPQGVVVLADEGGMISSTASIPDLSMVEPDTRSAGSLPRDVTAVHADVLASSQMLTESGDLLSPVRVGYDDGFVIASQRDLDLDAGDYAYRLRINGWGQLRDTVFSSDGSNPDLNQLQLKRARLIFSGHAFSSDLSYLVQLDGRSNAGDNLRILDYYFTFDLGHRLGNRDPGTIGFKAGLYKMPFSLARWLSGKQLEFSDRSMSSAYFDVNRSLAWGLYGVTAGPCLPLHWELALFNGLVTGGAETGSSGTLDNNNAVSGRVHFYPLGQWGASELADLTGHETIATRMGAGFALTTIDRSGQTEFGALRVVDSGQRLSDLLPLAVDGYDVALFSIDTSMKYRGLSLTTEVYLRSVSGFRGAAIADLFDHGLWLQAGMFVLPEKLQILSRWSRVHGNSGTLGLGDQSSEEIAGGLVWYFRQQHMKATVDATYLNGASISSSALDINPGDIGWLYRTQIQFSF